MKILTSSQISNCIVAIRLPRRLSKRLQIECTWLHDWSVLVQIMSAARFRIHDTVDTYSQVVKLFSTKSKSKSLSSKDSDLDHSRVIPSQHNLVPRGREAE